MKQNDATAVCMAYALASSCSYPVQVSLYAVVQDLCSQLGLCQLWPQKRRLHTHTLHTLLSAQIPAEVYKYSIVTT